MAERKEIAEHLGAQISYDPLVDDATAILSDHDKFDTANSIRQIRYGEFDTANSMSSSRRRACRAQWILCADLVTQHGRIVLVGCHQSNAGLRTSNMERWNFKAIDVVNGHVRRQDEKLDAMRQGHIVTAPLVTAFELDQVKQAFQALTDGTPGLYKTVMRMDAK